jgi:hypothetical protein
MLKQTIKRMVLTGAAVMVFMSTAAPAMAAPTWYQGGVYQDLAVYSNGGTITLGDINSGGNTGNTIDV